MEEGVGGWEGMGGMVEGMKMGEEKDGEGVEMEEGWEGVGEGRGVEGRGMEGIREGEGVGRGWEREKKKGQFTEVATTTSTEHASLGKCF